MAFVACGKWLPVKGDPDSTHYNGDLLGARNAAYLAREVPQQDDRCLRLVADRCISAGTKTRRNQLTVFSDQQGRRHVTNSQFTTHAERFDLSGKCVLVTGGTRGIGMMIARGLLQAGARVAISSRNAEACAQAQQHLSEFGDVLAVPADLARREECARLAHVVTADFESLDILVNNAGAMWDEPLETFPDAAWDTVIDLNLKSPFWLVQTLLPALRSAGTADDPARIINIGSIAAIHIPARPNYSYSSSKAALHQLTRVLAKELGPQHITVNAVAPGPFPSTMMAATLDQLGEAIAASAPLGRIGRDDDMAGVAVFLASRAGAYLTGTIVPVDGGIATTA